MSNKNDKPKNADDDIPVSKGKKGYNDLSDNHINKDLDNKDKDKKIELVVQNPPTNFEATGEKNLDAQIKPEEVKIEVKDDKSQYNSNTPLKN